MLFRAYGRLIMNEDFSHTDNQEHVLKGLRKLRYKKPEESLEDVRNSVRRWWWECLRLSKDYWLVCQTTQGQNIATQDEKLRRVYRRFGDIYKTNFDEWWVERGYRIFSEEEKFPKVKEVPRRPSERERQFPTEDKIWVEIPLKLSTRTIQKNIGRLLNEYESIRLNRRIELTTAEFKINPVQFGTKILQKVHEVYALHRELIEKPKWLKQHKPEALRETSKADLYRIGKLLKVSPKNESMSGTPDEVRARHNRMRVAVSRNIQKAELLIANTERGIFPSYEEVVLNEQRFTQRQLDQHKELESKWWELNFISELSVDKLSGVKGIYYDEPERTRQNNLLIQPRERIVIIRDA